MHPIVRAAALLMVFAFPALAAEKPPGYPTKPVRLLVGFAPGGGVDQTARILAPKLSELWHEPLVIDNRSGAGGTIATDLAAKAPADGYTLLFCGIWSHGVAPALYKSLPYDYDRDFAPVSMIGTTPNVLVVNPAVPVKTVSDFLAYMKANNGKTTIASPGVGSSPHMTMELFRLATKAEFVHVPYKGGAPALVDLLGGHIPAMFDNMTTQLALMKGGRTRALAVTSPKRSVHLPDVPTMREAGVPIEVTVWYAVCAPSAVPRPIIAKLNADLHRALAASDTQKKLVEIGIDVAPSTPEQLGAFIRKENEMWTRVVREGKIPQQTF
jgi:tripartite-type tricarboxylate transporter receptor subunit TctC